MLLSEVVGLASGALATSAFVPQVIRIWKKRPEPATAVSLPMYIIFCAGVLGWLVFGIMIRSSSVVLWNAATLILASSILFYKCRYG